MRAVVLVVCALILGWLAWRSVGAAKPREARERADEVVTAPPPEARPSAAPATPAPARATARAVGAVNVENGTVEVWLWRGDDARRLAREAFSGGAFEVPLPEFDALDRITGRLVAYAEADGFRRGESEAAGLEDAAAEIRLDVTLVAGAQLTGRVVDEAGRPAPHADVWLSPNDLYVSEGARPDGRFALPVDKAVEAWLCAQEGATGVAVRGPLHLSPLTSLDVGDLVLRGPGTLEGVAVYPDGAPVRRMQLHAVPEARHADKITSYPGPRVDATKDERAAEGLLWGWTETDDHGRFALRGLRTGRYFFLQDKNRRLFTTGANARVVIHRHRILVEIVDEKNEPVHVGLGISARSDRGASAAGAIDDLSVRPGDTWTIAIGSLDIVPVHETIAVAAGRYEYVARLVARPVRERGRIRVRALDPRGEPIPNIRLSLYTVPSGDVILYRDRVDEAGRSDPVPPGRYRLVATPGRDAFALYFPAEAEEVQVRAGAEADVTVRARAAGRARFDFRVEGKDGQDSLGRLRITATPQQGGEPQRLGAPLRRNEGGGYTLGGKWRLNEPTLANRLLAPGPYDLRIEADGYAPVALPLSIRPGEVTDLEVRLSQVR